VPVDGGEPFSGTTVREHVDDGGLVSYVIDLSECFRRGAYYVDKIIKGAAPSDLPVEFSTRLELVINLETARALSLTISPPLLARADEVVEQEHCLLQRMSLHLT
jgi:putative ABC transport system substrate-binding protein